VAAVEHSPANAFGTSTPPIIYTWTDEAPALATYAFLPVIRAYAGAAGVPVETRDISLAGRTLAAFPDYLTEGQRAADDLAELGRMVECPRPTSSSFRTSAPPCPS